MAGNILNITGSVGSTDVIYGGKYRIRGTVTKDGVACARKVYLFVRSSGVLIRSTWSGSDGSYVFNYIGYRSQDYFTVALDSVATLKNAAIADLITPELMP